METWKLLVALGLGVFAGFNAGFYFGVLRSEKFIKKLRGDE